MSELSKLLTFMFKEDRSEIIQQYNEMLDNAEDEQAMLESFGSPTRLAVAISRSYQRDERKLSVHADSKDGEDGEAVKVKPVIPTQGKKSSAPIIKPNEPEPDAYIDIIEEIRREKAAEEGIEYKPIFFKEEPEPESEAEVEPEAEVPDEEAAEDAAEAVDEAGEAPAEEAAAADEEKAEGESEAAQTEAKADDEAADAGTTEAAESEAEAAPQAEEAVRVVACDVLPASLARRAAGKLAQGARLALVLVPREAGWSFALCAQTEDVRPVVKGLCAAFGGKGGGPKDMAQGVLGSGSEAEIRERLVGLTQ